MLVLVTTKITKIHGIHPCKDGMAYNKTHVELRIIAHTLIMTKMTKVHLLKQISNYHQIALFQQHFGHQDEIK